MPRKKIRARKSARPRSNKLMGLLPASHPLLPYIEHPRFGIIDHLRADVLAAINSGDNTLSGGLTRFNKALANRGFSIRVKPTMWKRWIAALGITTRRAFVAEAAFVPQPQPVPTPRSPIMQQEDQGQQQWPEPQAALPLDVKAPSEGVQPTLPDNLFAGLDGQPDQEPVFARAGITGINNIPH